jgi:hypothetical protein
MSGNGTATTSDRLLAKRGAGRARQARGNLARAGGAGGRGACAARGRPRHREDDPVSHNFFIAGKVTPNLLPGKSATLTVKLKKKGHSSAPTTVTVNMVEYAFQLSQSSIPSGQITFVINNKGNEVHN